MVRVRERSGARRLFALSWLLPVLVLALLLSGAANAFAITRDTVLARAQKWVDLPVPYSQSKYYGGYRTDCSGFTSMSWQTGTSWSTRSLHNVSRVIAPADLKPGDALVKYNYHARVFYGWADDSHTRYVCYEQTGPTTKSSIKNIAADIAFGYVPYRYDKISDGPRPWNLVANPTFDVWASGAPVWWDVPEDDYWDSWARRTDLVKTGKSSLGLINPSDSANDVVEVSQADTITAGVPYTLSLWVSTGSDPAGLELRLRFLDADGGVLESDATTGEQWKVGATSLVKMSVVATAPADAVTAAISVRLAGGADASGTAGTRAVLDDFRLYDSSPVTTTCTVSATSITRRHTVTLRGRVNAPIPVGSVRIYVVRPGRTTPVFLADRPLVGGVWSLAAKPTLRGKYTFTAKYLGYGPYGPVTSSRVYLRVK